MEYSEDTVMETRGLTFSYDGEQNILENLDFAIPAGKVTVLMGANGCGKSNPGREGYRFDGSQRLR